MNPRCPKCGSADTLEWDNEHGVFCSECGSDFTVDSIASFAQFFMPSLVA